MYYYDDTISGFLQQNNEFYAAIIIDDRGQHTAIQEFSGSNNSGIFSMDIS